MIKKILQCNNYIIYNNNVRNNVCDNNNIYNDVYHLLRYIHVI